MLILYVSPILNTVIPYLVFIIKRLKTITCREILLQALISEFLAAFVRNFIHIGDVAKIILMRVRTLGGRTKTHRHQASQ